MGFPAVKSGLCDAASQCEYNELVYNLLKIIPSGRRTILQQYYTEGYRDEEIISPAPI